MPDPQLHQLLDRLALLRVLQAEDEYRRNPHNDEDCDQEGGPPGGPGPTSSRARGGTNCGSAAAILEGCFPRRARGKP